MPSDSSPKPRSFVRPPEQFDPLTATSKELLLHGFPPPPSAHSPRALSVWKKAMVIYRESQVRYLAPQFAPLPSAHQVKSARPVAKATFGEVPSVLGDYSGIAVLPMDPTTDSMQSITSKFTVPNVYPVDNPFQFGGIETGNFWAFAWIGIDGLTTFGGGAVASSDLLAVGSATTIRGGVRDCYFWYAWYWNDQLTDAAGRLTNVTVAPGDTVIISVCSDDTGQQPSIFISNLSARQYSSFYFETPPAFLARPRLFGSSVEAIVSTAVLVLGTDAQGRTEWNTHLPRYGEVLFQEPIIFTKSGKQILDFSSAVVLSMVDRAQNVISTAERTQLEAFRAYYVGP